ncbi:response regulator [Sulfitobacter guttiformis]|uniref:Response regulator receiver domain-containing protein n=1 Tax=Sulfitobacter guttiformis TaxID=74349 RepID=A0A420DJA9_9RHOB|nr:response regulator [Sulfitobacter guttiformis]KIN71892.1 Response regulator receiver domain protein [Sulfitobacter guttiformis KCTC 32187]RKE94298.1 response regulator receiver domain-containing protein [Sulfitobacter guttiformis]
MRILAIDDDPIILDTISHYLSGDLNYALECHASAESALASLNEAQLTYDCILLDIMLPGTNGIEFCQVLRRMKKYSSTPILMITSNREPGLMQRAFDAGATDFLPKPLNAIELRARVISAGMLNQSIATANDTQQELNKLRKMRFDDIPNLDVEGVYDIRDLENYFLRFRPGCYAMSLINLHIDALHDIFNPKEPSIFLEGLRHSAQAMAAVMGPDAAKIAYVGKGYFVGVNSGRNRINILELTNRFNQELSMLWDCTATGMLHPPTGKIRLGSDQRFWSGLSIANKLREFAPISEDAFKPTSRVEDNLFTELAW